MQAYMNINVRVLSAAAQTQIKALQAQVKALQAQLAAGGAGATGKNAIGGPTMLTNLRRYGSQLQWTGRQIRYNFTLPLALAAGAAVKFALDNEKAMTRVTKVYGDTADATAFFNKQMGLAADSPEGGAKAAAVFKDELGELEKAFAALSSHYGVQQKEVIETAGAWAAAGSSGIALAKSVELSLQAAILGDMDLAKATQSLIAIQSQYSLDTEGLILTLAELNAIENQTGISMEGLIQGFERAAGSAREYGVDVRHLGAMLAALVPSTGTAATAGNALKTILSRIMAPTKESTALMKEFGIVTTDASWKSATGMDRLRILARKMADDVEGVGKKGQRTAEALDKMSDAQRAVVATTLGSRYQVNRFLVLMRELNNDSGYYAKALNATADNTKVLQQKTRELNTVLESSPKRLEILMYTIQNGMADAIGPLIPYLIWMVLQIQKVTTAFGNLDPAWQKFILLALLAVAAVGPVLAIFGSLMTLISLLFAPIGFLGGALMSLARVFAFVVPMVRAFWFVLGLIGPMIFAVVGRLNLLKVVGPIFGVMASALGAAVGFMMRITSVGTLWIVTKWIASQAAMLAMATISYGLLAFRWVATLNFMAATSALQGVWKAFSGMMLKLLTAAWFYSGQLKLVFFSMSVAVDYYLTAAWVRIVAGFKLMWAALYAVGTFFVPLLGGIWSGLYILMAEIATWGKGLIAAIHVQMYALLATLQTAWAATVTTVHTALQGTMAAIDRVGGAIRLALQTAWNAASLALQALWAYRALIAQAAFQALARAAEIVWFNIRMGAWVAFHGALLAVQKTWAALTIGLQKKTFAMLGKIAMRGIAFILGPWGLLIAGIIALIIIFRDQIVKIWTNIVNYFGDSTNGFVEGVLNAWNALPTGVSNALTAVAKIVESAAKAIYGWFSYINPFARHSPSLVENVTNGMAEVRKQFATVGSIGAHIKGAYADIKAFGKAVAGLLKGASSFEFLEDLKKIKKFMPGAVDEFVKLNNRLTQLNADLAKLQARMDAQQRVVDRWQAAVDAANKKLDKQQAILDRLTAKQDKWQSKLDEAKDRLSEFANAPIKGMGEMSDRIFENEMAQKRLRLEMMKMEDATGPLDDVKSKIDAINGAQELLSGKKSDLRAGGAGGDILKTYDDQIAALEAQRKAYDDASAPLQKMQDQLDALQRKGEELDLTQSLKFDPLTRQIEQAANAMEEMPFDKIMAGVQQAQADIEKYGGKLADASAEVAAQQAVVDRLTKSRDKLQAALDRESEKLDQIKKQYDKVADAISAVEQTMQDAVSAADAMARKMEELKKKGEGYVPNAVQNYRDAAGGNFADAGGAGIPMRDDWSSQADEIKTMYENLNGDTAAMFDKLNPFAPIKEKWNEFRGWWSGVWGGLVAGTKDMFSNIFSGVSLGNIGGGFSFDTSKVTAVVDQLKIAWQGIKSFIGTMVDYGQRIWRLFWPSIKEIAQNAWAGLKKLWDKIAPELQKIIAELRPLFTNFLAFMKPIIAFLVLRFSFIGKVIMSVVAKTIKPAIELIGGVLGNALQMLRGAIQIISGIFAIIGGIFSLNGDMIWKGVKKLISGILNLFSGLFGGIGQIIKNGFKIVVGAIWGVVKGVWDWFMWLWDELIGHSIIPDIVNGIFWWFNKLIELAKWVFDNVVTPVINAFQWLWDKVTAGAALLWEGLKAAWNGLTNAATWLWNNLAQPVINAVQRMWGWVKDKFRQWWAGVKLVWQGLKLAGKWIWENMALPVINRVKDLWNRVREGLATWWSRIVAVWNGLKSLGKWVWDNVLNPVWSKFTDAMSKVKGVVEDARAKIVEKFNGIKEGVGNVIQYIKDAPQKIKDLGQAFFNAGGTIIQKLIDGFKSVKDVIGNIAGTLWDYLKDIIDDTLLEPLANALNFRIKIWKFDKEFNFGKYVPRLYTGGIVPGSANGQLVIAGDRGHDEAIIPLTGPNSPFSRLNNSNNEAGKFRSDMIGPSGTTNVINIYGNLSFPNIKSSDDVEEFINNLENLSA